jgi:hypothetical protein
MLERRFLIARSQVFGAIPVLSPYGPKAVKVISIDLVNNESRLTIDSISGSKRIIPAHSKSLIGRTANRPLDSECCV